MLEVFYEEATKVVTAWRSEGRIGIRELRDGESKIILDIELPSNKNASCRDYLYDESTESLVLNPDYTNPKPPDSTHISTLVSIDVGNKRPAKVKRVWEGNDYFYDCFVTENIKDQYVNGDIKVGDHLLVLFEMGEQIVTAKVFKSW